MLIGRSIPVPWTSAPPSMTLGHRRAEVAAFWIVFTPAVMTAVGLLVWALGLNWPAVWALAGFLILLPRLFRSDWFELGVRGWNRGVGIIAALLRGYVLRVCYFLFLAVTSASGSALRRGQGVSGASGWIPRSLRDLPMDVMTPGASGPELRMRELPGAGGKWANAWMVLLKPFVVLLRLLRAETRDSAPPSSTYTLY
jgi:hypothetical protein